jgi:hypothetical protein
MIPFREGYKVRSREDWRRDSAEGRIEGRIDGGLKI